MSFEAVLAQKKIELPEATAPRVKIRPFMRVGDVIHLSGQICQWNGEIKYVGKLGREFGVEEGYQAGRLCSLNLLAQLRRALGDSLDPVVRCIRIGGYVNSMPDFFDQPKVINGCSEVMTEIFGEAGEHARTAIGVAALPFNAAVEADAIFEVR